MTYYIISIKNLNDENLFLADNDGLLYWERNNYHNYICKFETSNNATDFIESKKEFNEIINDGKTIQLPVLLQGVNYNSISILEVILFKNISSVYLSTVISEYKTRRDLFEAKLTELKQI